MTYLLDTVAISETHKQDPDHGMRAFLENVPESDLMISVVTVAELHFGWSRLPVGARQRSVQRWVEDVEEAFEGRIMPIDSSIAAFWGQLRAEVQGSGFNVGLQDLLIAATALQHNLTVVTRNVKDFTPTGCRFINPWEVDT